MVSDTCLKMEGDEILSSLKQDPSLEEFRIQRLQEIIKDCFSMEKEQYIDKLIEANAYLKTQIELIHQNKQKEYYYLQEQEINLNKQIIDLKTLLEKETTHKKIIQNELDKMQGRQRIEKDNYDELIKARDQFFQEQSQNFTNQLSQYKGEIENLKQINMKLKQEALLHEEKSKELNRNLENMRQVLQEKDLNSQGFEQQQQDLNTMVGVLQQKMQEIQKEKSTLEIKNQKLLQENQNIQEQYQQALKEKEQNAKDISKFQSQITQIMDVDIKEKDSKLIENKQKYKEKIKNLKGKLKETKQNNDTLTFENQQIKQQLEENEKNYEKVTTKMQGDMKLIKREWEKKCQEVEQNNQQEIAYLKEKHQNALNHMQSEYQKILDKKVLEIEEETSNQFSKTKNMDKEIREQLEVKMALYEREYIHKAKHESILEQEISNIKQQWSQKIKEIQERHEKEITQKMREVSERKDSDFDLLTEKLKKLNKNLLAENEECKSEVKMLKEQLTHESENQQWYQKEQEHIQLENQELNTMIQQQQKEINDTKQQLSNKTQKIDEAEKLIKSWQQKFNQVQEELNLAQEELQRSNQQILDINNANKEAQKQREKDSLQIEQLIEELEKKDQQVNDMNNNIATLQQENQELYEKLQSSISEIEQEYQNQLTIQQEKFEKAIQIEINDHEVTKKQLEKFEQYKQNSANQTTQKQQELLQTISDLKNQLQLTQDNAKQLETINQRSEAKVQQTGSKQLQDKKQFLMALKVLQQKMQLIRSSLLNLQEQNKYDLQEYQNFLDKFQDDVIKDRQNFGLYIEEEIKKTYERALDEFSNQIAQLQEQSQECQNLEKQITSLEYENEQLKEQCSVTNTNLIEAKQDAQALRKNLAEVDGERLNLQQMLANSNKGYQELSEYVQKELKRVKQDSQNLVTALIKQNDDKWAQEILVLQEAIARLKSRHQQELLNIDADISKLSYNHNKEIKQYKNDLENQVEALLNEGNLQQKEIMQKNSLIDKLREELQLMEENYERIQQENKEAFNEFEEKLQGFKDIMKDDGEKYLKLKCQSDTQIDHLKYEVQRLTIDLQQSQDKLKELQNIKEGYRNEIKTLKQSTTFYGGVSSQGNTLQYRGSNTLSSEQGKFGQLSPQHQTNSLMRLRDIKPPKQKQTNTERDLQELQHILQESYQKIGLSGGDKNNKAQLKKGLVASVDNFQLDQINTQLQKAGRIYETERNNNDLRINDVDKKKEKLQKKLDFN